MPYYVFQVAENVAEHERFVALESFDAYREARNFARAQRRENPDLDARSIRVVFAESSELAENLLRQPREAPILREWEK